MEKKQQSGQQQRRQTPSTPQPRPQHGSEKPAPRERGEQFEDEPTE